MFFSRCSRPSMGQMFIEQCGCTTFNPVGGARVLKPRFCYKHLTHSGSVNRYKYAKVET
jgi:hypothetical protein